MTRRKVRLHAEHGEAVALIKRLRLEAEGVHLHAGAASRPRLVFRRAQQGRADAAAAWGATYTATCIDVPSLRAFANDHYGHGREVLCTDGVDVASMPVCGG